MFLERSEIEESFANVQALIDDTRFGEPIPYIFVFFTTQVTAKMDSVIARREPNSLEQRRIHIDRIRGFEVCVNGYEMHFYKD